MAYRRQKKANRLPNLKEQYRVSGITSSGRPQAQRRSRHTEQKSMIARKGKL